MLIPFFTPPVVYKAKINRGAHTIESLCKQAGIACRASGAWVSRSIDIVQSETLVIFSEPHNGNARIGFELTNPEQDAQRALLVLAYTLHDLVAKQSVAGMPFTKVTALKAECATRR